MHPVFLVLLLGGSCLASQPLPEPPKPEPIDVIELPLPPALNSTAVGACTRQINAKGTGCIGIGKDPNLFQSGDFTPDGRHVIVTVEFIGAPKAPAPASIYSGLQLILVKTDGTTFPNGDPWKCLTCGVPANNAVSIHPEGDYPHVFRSGDRALWGRNIVDCQGALLQSKNCTPTKLRIYPIYWPTSKDQTGPGGSPRELRLHPDDEHMGWSAFTHGGQFAYLGRIKFNKKPQVGEPLAPRYDLVDVQLLVDPTSKPFVSAEGDELQLNPDSITIGELRGFSGTGDEITYVGTPTESCNIDAYAAHLTTGKVRRLTAHPEYVDPIGFSADDKWMCVMDTRGSDRQMFMAGMRGIPPLIDLVANSAASSTRNNGPRRFFQPILIDAYGDRGNYFGQQVNAAGDGSNGAVNDPNWNGRADPFFSMDGTQIVYWQTLVTPPACGGHNPLPCPKSTAEGGRTNRMMLARLTSRKPTKPKPVFKVPKQIPWAIPFPPGSSTPSRPRLLAGNYTLYGKVSGQANVTLIENELGTWGIGRVIAEYDNYSDDGDHVINGFEDVTANFDSSNPWTTRLDWFSDINQVGVVTGSKKTSNQGFHISIDVLVNELEANGTLTTILDGKAYHQPANGT